MALAAGGFLLALVVVERLLQVAVIIMAVLVKLRLMILPLIKLVQFLYLMVAQLKV
jgi:hypothetical protein